MTKMKKLFSILVTCAIVVGLIVPTYAMDEKNETSFVDTAMNYIEDWEISSVNIHGEFNLLRESNGNRDILVEVQSDLMLVNYKYDDCFSRIEKM